MDVVTGAAVADGKVTPKVQSLIKVLLKYQYTEDFRAIIFVERVVAALVLPKVKCLTCLYKCSRFVLLLSRLTHCSFLLNTQVFAELPSLSFINSASLIGHNNSQEMRTSQMQDTISKFRDGRVYIETDLVIMLFCFSSVIFVIHLWLSYCR